jgi:hypothetical protein
LTTSAALATVFATDFFVFDEGFDAPFDEDLVEGAADFWVPLADDVFAFAFDVSATVSAGFFDVGVTGDATVVVTGSALATTSSTTAETFIRLTSFTTALVLGGSGAMLKAVTGVLTVTCSSTSASTTTDRRTTLDDVAVRDCVDTAMRGAGVGATVVGGCAAIGSVEGIVAAVVGTAGFTGLLSEELV